MKRNITIMAKNPFKALVKTRLAREIGGEAARGVYTRLLFQNLSMLVSSDQTNINLTLSLASEEDEIFFRQAFPEFQITHQVAGDLGAKMLHAFQQAFQAGAHQSVLIGSDLPFMNWGLLNQAFRNIDDVSIVLGPSPDGGYYLIGMQNPGLNVFKKIPWGTKHVLNLTLEQIKAHNYQPILLPEHQDIDRSADLRAWQADLMSVDQLFTPE